MRSSVLAISSGGGHWIQLLRLRDAFAGCDVAYVSVDPSYGGDVAGQRFYVVQNVTRWDRWSYAKLVVQLVRILVRERPTAIISTGAGPGVIAIVLGKLLLRVRTMWIDSVANSERLSLSGRLVRHFADVRLTQWPNLAERGGTQYWGSVL